MFLRVANDESAMDFYQNEKKDKAVFGFLNPVIGNFQETLTFDGN